MSALNPVVEEFAIAVVDRAKRNLGATRTVGGKQRRSVNTGTLRDSLTYVNKSRYGGNTVQFTAEGKAKIYASFVHDGRKPGATPPPVTPILEWVKKKPIRIRDKVTNKFKKMGEKHPKYDGTVDQVGLAFAIAKSIGKKGIAAFPYFADAVKEELEIRGPLFLDALERELELRLNLK